MSWYKRTPLLLENEKKALSKSGYDFEIDKDALSQNQIVINVKYTHAVLGREPHILKCVYPASYPFFPVSVFGPTLPLGRHINPDDHRLCLYQDEQNTWRPDSDSLAKALDEQLPIILERHKNFDVPSKDEEQVGYQITGQLRYEARSVIFVDNFITPESEQYGEMAIRLSTNCQPNTPISGLLESTNIGNDLSSAGNSPISELFNKPHKARWVKLDTIPENATAQGFLEAAAKVWPAIKTPAYGKISSDILGVLIPEESEYRVPVFNWVFIVRRRPKKNSKNKHHPTPSLIRSDRYTDENILSRVPRLTNLANKKITIIGLGALGSQIAWQLARSGIKSLTLIDCDIVQAGNLPRWLMGFPAIGWNKVDAISLFLINNYPGISCRPFPLRIGISQNLNVDGHLIDERDFLCELINQSDLIIDAAAETNLSLYISHLCDEEKVPYLWATGTQGAWGGIVGRSIPDTTGGTWTDFSYRYANGSISAPPAEEDSDVQPVGCFSPTFTGSGFDLDHVSLMATRLAVSTICKKEGGYPDFDWDIGILHLWNEESGIPIAPKWKTYKQNEFK